MNADVKKVIDRVFELARIDADASIFQKVASQAGRVIEYFESLNELDTSKTVATSHAIEACSLLREDEIFKATNVENILDQVPKLDEHFVQVPKII